MGSEPCGLLLPRSTRKLSADQAPERRRAEKVVWGEGTENHGGLSLRKTQTTNKVLKLKDKHTNLPRLGNWPDHFISRWKTACRGHVQEKLQLEARGGLATGLFVSRSAEEQDAACGRRHLTTSFLLGGSMMRNQRTLGHRIRWPQRTMSRKIR